jgi:phosphotransferase family enzyme
VAARAAEETPEPGREAIPTGARTWLDPGWRAAALGWVETELANLDRRVVGPVEQPHVRPWSTAMRIPTNQGDAWFKATGPGPAHEGPLLEVFRALGVCHVVLPLAVHERRPWLLFDDAGPTLRSTRPDGRGDHDLAAWERILAEYAALQRSVESDDAVAAMLAAGVPDGRPARLAGELERLLDDDLPWAGITDEERVAAEAARQRLRQALPTVRTLAGELAASGVAVSIQHDDFHGGNIVVGPDGDRFFDWGDAVVAHPFGTLTTTFNSIAHKTDRRLDDPVFSQLQDVYLEAWTDVLPRAALAELAGTARLVACIGKALAWERALLGLATDEMDDHGDAVAGWLVEFEQRLGAWAR